MFIITSLPKLQSNLGRGPRRGAVAHARRKVPIGYNSAPHLQTPTICLIPGLVRPTMPNSIRIRSAVFPQCIGQADRPTDRSRESLMTIGRCAARFGICV